MLYNKSENRKINDKKVMHKIKKHWVVVSSAILMALGGYAAATRTPSVHADQTNNNGNNNVNTIKENLNTQLTDRGGNALSPIKGQNSRQNNGNAQPNQTADITSQARNLHSQIMQNNMNRGSAVKANQKTALGNLNAVHSLNAGNSTAKKQPATNNGGNQKSNQNPANGQNSQNNQGQTKAADNNSGKSSQPTISYGTVNVQYEDINNNNKLVSSGVGSTIGSDDAPFTQAQKASYERLAPSGYQYAKILNDVNHFEANKTQNFVIGVTPLKNYIPTYNRIVIRYVDTNHGDETLSTVQNSDSDGTPFNVKPFEQNVPSDYKLDTTRKDSISYNNGPSDSFPAGSLGTIKYKPGVQLIQIGVKSANQPQQTVRIPVSYVVRGTNGAKPIQVGSDTIPGTVDSPVTANDLKSYEQNVPSGYQYANATSQLPKTFAANDQPIEIYVSKDQPNVVPSDTMTINFLNASDNDNNVHTLTASGKDGSSFDYNQYRNMVPSGYQFVNFSGNVPNVYTKDGELNVLVKPAGNKLATMTIAYAYSNGAPIESEPVSGQNGAPFNVSQYEQNVPSGTSFVSASNVPDKFTNGAQISVIVKPTVAPKVSMDVNYIDKSTNKLVSDETVTGNAGSSFDPDYYRYNAPQGYQYAGDASELPTTFKSGTDMEIYVTPISKPATTVSMPVNYIYNGAVKGTLYDKGQAGTQINNLNQYEKLLPQGYSFVSFSNDNPTVYTQGKGLIINVKPAQQQQLVHMAVNYLDNGKSVGNASIAGDAGTQFTSANLEPYVVNVPNGYQYKSASNVPSKFIDGATIDINVLPVTVEGQINLMYINAANNKQVGKTYALSGITGTKLNLASYEKNLPMANSSVVGVVGDDTFTKGSHNVLIKINQNNNNPIKSQYGYIVIHYVYDNGNKAGDDTVTTNKAGTPFNFQNYTNDAPQGNRFVKILQGSNVNTYLANETQNVKVEVAPVQNNANNNQAKTDYMFLSFVDANNNSVGKPVMISGIDKTPINWGQYSSKVPSGYKVTGVVGNVPSTYESNAFVKFRVAKNTPKPSNNTNNNQTQNVTTTLLYEDVASGHPVVRQYLISGPQGQTIDYSKYENNNYLPSGYQITDLTAGTSEFEPNTDMVIYVQKAAQSNTADNNVTPAPTPSSSTNFVPQPNTNNTMNNGSSSNTSNQPTPMSDMNNGINNNQAPAQRSSEPTANTTNPTNTTNNTNTTPNVNPTNTPATDTNDGTNGASNNGGDGNIGRRQSQPVANGTQGANGNTINPNATTANNGTGATGQSQTANNSAASSDGAADLASLINNNNTSSDNIANSASNNAQSNGSKLPQTGEAAAHSKKIAAILVSLGVDLSALGYAINKRRRHDN